MGVKFGGAGTSLANLASCAPHSPPPFCWGRGVEPPTKFSKGGGGLDSISTLRGGLLEKRGNFFQGGCNFYTQKTNQNQKYLTAKKVYKQKYFSLS